MVLATDDTTTCGMPYHGVQASTQPHTPRHTMPLQTGPKEATPSLGGLTAARKEAPVGPRCGARHIDLA